MTSPSKAVMPGDRTHDSIGTVLGITWLIVGVVSGVREWTIAAAAFLVGTLFLSPDLDLKSASYRRWGPLRVIWLPYMAVVPHRAWVSHGPVWGTVLRIVWLVAVSLPALTVLHVHGVISLDRVIAGLYGHPIEVFAVLIGLEASALVHLAADIVFYCRR